MAFFDAVRAAIAKIEVRDGRDGRGLNWIMAIRQIVSENMTGTGVVDIYAEAGEDRQSRHFADRRRVREEESASPTAPGPSNGSPEATTEREI